MKWRELMTNKDQQSPIGIMVCGHGSRDKGAEREFGRVAEGLKKRFPGIPVSYGFLEFSAPNIHMGINELLDQGVKDIYAVPGMLFAATHAKNDIPSVLTSYEEKQADVHVHYGNELGLHSAMIEAFQTRIYESLGIDPNAPPENLYDTMLVVVGRGTSDTMANAEVAKLMRIVNENMGFGWADVVYSGVTYPSVGEGLERLSKLGFKKIVVAPYFLFTGRLIKRIYGYVDHVAKDLPEIEFIKTPYLNDHEKVIDAFEVRVRELMEGQDLPEDLMASFKRRLAAGEVDLHHHHSEFNPELPDANNHENEHQGHSHGHSHGNDHSKDKEPTHSHGIYKHIGHPLGPRTMIGDGICSCFMRQFPQHILDEETERLAKVTDEIPLAHQQ
jgi:sirohydrochlorin cobaltochelatase